MDRLGGLGGLGGLYDSIGTRWDNWQHELNIHLKDAAELYEIGTQQLAVEGGRNFYQGVECLKVAASKGNNDATATLRSLCESFARKKIHHGSDEPTWCRFKALLFAAYPQPWEQFDFLKTQPDALAALPHYLCDEIYQSNLTAANQGNVDALFARGVMQSQGFSVERSLIEAAMSLCLAKKAGHAQAAQLLDEFISQIKAWFMLPPSPPGTDQITVPVADQSTLIHRILSRKPQEDLAITHHDIVTEWEWLKTQFEQLSGDPTVTKTELKELSAGEVVIAQRFESGLKGGNEKVRIATETRPLPLDIWRDILSVSTWVKGASSLSQCDKRLADGSKLLWQVLLREWVVIPEGKSARKLCFNSFNLKYQFIAASIGLTPQVSFFSEPKSDQVAILKRFYQSINTCYFGGLSENVERLIKNAWFQNKVRQGLLDLDIVLKFPHIGISQLSKECVQEVLDRHPRFLAGLKNAAPGFWECLNSNEQLQSFLFSGAIKDEQLFKMTRQGRWTLEQNGVGEFLSAHPDYIDFYLTVSLHDDIFLPLRHQVIQRAFVEGKLTWEQFKRPAVFNTLCFEDVLTVLTKYPELLGQVIELRSALKPKSRSVLDRGDAQRMLATEMLVLKQLNEIIVTAFGIQMDAQIIIDAAERNVIPTDVRIELYNIAFGSLPDGALYLPGTVKLTKFELRAGVLKVGHRQWTGPCIVRSSDETR